MSAADSRVSAPFFSRLFPFLLFFFSWLPSLNLLSSAVMYSDNLMSCRITRGCVKELVISGNEDAFVLILNVFKSYL